MNVTDMLISAILKKGILYEGRNCNLEVDIPITKNDVEVETPNGKINIKVTTEHMTLRIEKKEES